MAVLLTGCGAAGTLTLHDVELADGLTAGEDMQLQQEDSDTVISFTWRTEIARYTLATEYPNGSDPAVVLLLK